MPTASSLSTYRQRTCSGIRPLPTNKSQHTGVWQNIEKYVLSPLRHRKDLRRHELLLAVRLSFDTHRRTVNDGRCSRRRSLQTQNKLPPTPARTKAGILFDPAGGNSLTRSRYHPPFRFQYDALADGRIY